MTPRLRPCIHLGILLALSLLLQPRAWGFKVYCTNNSDGTVSCSGWEGGELLTCVLNPGGTSSCSTPSGRRFLCVRDGSGVSSCLTEGAGGMDTTPGAGTNCTFTGDGNFNCTPPRAPSGDLLPRPSLPPGTSQPGPTVPVPLITDPSVFDQ